MRLTDVPAGHGGPWLSQFAALAAAGVLALLLTAVQLLPTLELAGLSSRQGGLPANEVMSFSLPPVLLTRALLPGYGQSLFSEYVAFLPLTFLALAFIGAWGWRRRPLVFATLALALLGLFLALGVFNPFYWLLARLPGFDLFRAPARWLVLYALGMSLLAGVGWQVLADALREGTVVAQTKRPLIWFAIITVLLMVWGWSAGFMTGVLPTGLEAPFEAPSAATFGGWIVELFALLLLLALLPRARSRELASVWLVAVAGLGMAGLFLATRALPYNNLTTPEAYFDLRPSTTRLLAAGTPADRFLSLSDIFFDPGDQAEIDSIYADQLSAQARYDYTIAIKQKEIIAPNLPMGYGLAAVDGFDGGILPLRSYSDHVALVLPQGTQTTDGRLREQLDEVPDEGWLDLINARYLITDKVGDEWREGVFYDRQHQVTLALGRETAVGHVPSFAATEIRLLATGQPAQVAITTLNGETAVIETEALGDGLYRAQLPQPGSLGAITVSGCRVTACTLQALTLVDARDGTFVTLSPGNYRQIHSGDVKIYENLDVQPRAFLAADWQWVDDSGAANEIMREALFDGRAAAVLVSPAGAGAALPLPGQAQGAPAGTAAIARYTAEEVHIQTDSETDAMLLLTDAAYPGWSASVDGRASPIYVADGLFRAVHVPAGGHEVRFIFAPRSYEYGRLLSLAGLALLVGLGGYLWLTGRENRS